jgi:hypothetical protein
LDLLFFTLFFGKYFDANEGKKPLKADKKGVRKMKNQFVKDVIFLMFAGIWTIGCWAVAIWSLFVK